ncbi:MAG: ABC transporter ATP-binding protein [Hyphomicrobiaceae bacterium]|nr:MAG: ABC transporter ATP-binding protein [Hyphomicrobiaceae bacterium]
MGAAVEVAGLSLIGRDDSGRTAEIVKDVSFSIGKGEVLALIGESGSGKTTIALAMMGYVRPGCRITGGAISIEGRPIASLSRSERSALRGRKVAYVAQSAAAAFNPARRLMPQVIEGARIHGTLERGDARAKAIGLFRSLSLPDPQTIGDRYPHQVSGGQLQRIMLAMAMMTDPAIVILDEPTTALDVTTQIEVLRTFKDAVRQKGMTALYVSHDLAVVAQMADRIVVLRKGEVVETGNTRSMIDHPQNAYTQDLLEAADPAAKIAAKHQSKAARDASEGPLLEVKGVFAGYGAVGKSGVPSIPVLRDVNLTIERGTSVGVIGESGSGKSTLARVIAGLLPAARGSVAFEGRLLDASASRRPREQLRDIQIVFQMADTALNPSHTVGRILARPLKFYHKLDGEAGTKRVTELLDMVRLPANFAGRLPGELSGGQKQRVNLARALAAKPKLVLCDEVTSGLDTVVGAAILKLLADLRRDLELSYLFISHDLSTVQAVCDEIVILYAGQRVEMASREAIRTPPLHPYADLLLSSIPELEVGWLDRLPQRCEREKANAAVKPSAEGCAFFDRCDVALAGTCDRIPPPERQLRSGALVLCHRDEAQLSALKAPAARSALGPTL